MSQSARRFVSLIAGLMFGTGLAISGMLDPSRVRGFLDIFGVWDPSLAFVLGGAVAVSAVGYLISRTMKHPVLDDTFRVPEKNAIDLNLVLGAAIFGIGWGVSGLCPGPAVASLVFAVPAMLAFTFAMLVGVFVHDRCFAGRQQRRILR